MQHNDGCLFPSFPKHEIPESDFASWNTRAPVEYDGWFYLPKPKESIVQYGAQRIEKTETGYRAEQPVEVIEGAIRSWGDEMGEHIMKRICEVFNPVETCEMEYVSDWMSWHCKACDMMDMAPRDPKPRFCKWCGRKVTR